MRWQCLVEDFLAANASTPVTFRPEGLREQRVSPSRQSPTATASIDLCQEAAVKLDMIHEGSARVRLEILPDDKATASKTKAAAW